MRDLASGMRQLAGTRTEISMIPKPPNSPGQAFSRGIRLKCPMCGEGRLFHGFIRMQKKCSGCAFQFDRGPGYFLGSTYINYGVTTLLTTWSYMVLRFGFEISKSVLIPTLAAFCVIFPVLFFRYARSLWLSFDCYFDRTGAMEGMSEREKLEDEQL